MEAEKGKGKASQIKGPPSTSGSSLLHLRKKSHPVAHRAKRKRKEGPDE